MTLPSRIRFASSAADCARGLRCRPLWSAAVRAALHSCRLSMPLRRNGPDAAASVRWSLLVMYENPTTTVILSERSLPAVAGDVKDLYLPRLPAFPSKRDSRVAALILWSPFAMSNPFPFRIGSFIPIRTEHHS